uniref:GATA zinc finger domain-containing protein 1 n=1 Tax=Trichobilharzia regenti TaxID=157069 RepID=A0AA85JM33_TRIRE|nr:unnamed protein product [Trichobilharzia regenti]
MHSDISESTGDAKVESQKLVSEASYSNGTSQTFTPTSVGTRRETFENEMNRSPTSPTGLHESLRSPILSYQSRKSPSRCSIVLNKPRELANSQTLTRKSCIFHEGVRYLIGDVVSLLDIDGGVYYAQIRGLATDSYGDNFCFLTWLIPVLGAKEGEFRPSDYIIGIWFSFILISP